MKRKPLVLIGCFALLSAGAVAYLALSNANGVDVAQTSIPAAVVGQEPKAVASKPAEELPADLGEAVEGGASTEASKLSNYPGFGHDIDQDEETFSEEELAREKYIADCMNQNGFQYEPSPSIVIDEEAMSNPEEFERLLALSATDPNESYVSSLSEDMQKSYYMTLVGMEDPNDPEGQAHDLAQHGNSCTNQAFQKIPGVYAKRNVLSEEFDAMERRVEEDERVSKAQEDWSECMGDDGFAFSRPSDVHKYTDQVMAEVFEGSTPDDEKAYTDAELEKMMQIADRCVEASNLSEIKKRVRVEYENQFVKAHREQLER